MRAFKRTVKNLREARRLYLLSPQGLRDVEIAERLGVTRQTAHHYRRSLTVQPTTRGRYTAAPDCDELIYAAAIQWRIDHEGRDPCGDCGSSADAPGS